MSKLAIQVEGLGKEYIIGGAEQRHDSFREMLTGALTAPLRKLRKLGGTAGEEERFWALKDVSFSVEPGEVLGIIGRNGAGKSTLLKVLSRITSPTQGRVITRGRVASLLEVGTGFHPELTGRENIFLNGAILGMSKTEIDSHFDEIVEFAGVERFLDTPVKRYSSGMYIRLAFGVAAHLNPEILIVDEVLAVGDAQFQKKCLGKMQSVAGSGTTVIFVSHNMSAVQRLCYRAICLDSGQILFSGTPLEVIKDYMKSSNQTLGDRGSWPKKRRGNGKIRAQSLSIISNGCESETVQTGEQIIFRIQYTKSPQTVKVDMHIVIDNLYGEHMLYLGTDLKELEIFNPQETGQLNCVIKKLTLMPGRYVVSLYLIVDGFLGDEVLNAGEIEVVEGLYFESGRLPPAGYGNVVIEHEWKACAVS